MLAVLSPAKSLDSSPPPAGVASSQPVMMRQATSLMRTARGLSQKRLRELMNISADLKSFDCDRYAFMPDRSTDERFVFGRAFIPAGS